MTKFEKKNQMEYMMNHTNKTNPIKFKEKFDFYYFHSLKIIEGDQSNKDVLIDTIIQNSKMTQEDKLKLKQRRQTLVESDSFRKTSYRELKDSGVPKANSKRIMMGMPSLVNKNLKMEENETAKEKKEFEKYKHIKSIVELKKEDEQLSRMSGTELFNYYNNDLQTIRTYNILKSTIYSSKLKINLDRITDRLDNDNFQNIKTKHSTCSFKPAFRTIDVNTPADVYSGCDTHKFQGSTIFSGSTHPKSKSTSLEFSVTNRQLATTHRSLQSYNSILMNKPNASNKKKVEGGHAIHNLRKCLPVAISKVKRNDFRKKAEQNKELQKQHTEKNMNKITESLERKHKASIAIKAILNQNGKSSLFMAQELLNKSSEQRIDKPHLEFISESISEMKNENRFHSPLSKIKHVANHIKANQKKTMSISQIRKDMIYMKRYNKPLWLTPKPIKQNKINNYQILQDIRSFYRSLSMDSISSSDPYLKLKFSNKLKKHNDQALGKRIKLASKFKELLKYTNLSVNYTTLHIKSCLNQSNINNSKFDAKNDLRSTSKSIRYGHNKNSCIKFRNSKEKLNQHKQHASISSSFESNRNPNEKCDITKHKVLSFSDINFGTEKENENCLILNNEYLEKYAPDEKSNKDYIISYFDKEIDVEKIAENYFYALLPSIRPSKLDKLNIGKIMQAYAKNMAIDIDILLEYLNKKSTLINSLLKASDPIELKKFYKSKLIPNYEAEFNKLFSIYPNEIQEFMKTQYIKKYGNPLNNFNSQINLFMKNISQRKPTRNQSSDDMQMIEKLMKEYSLLDRIKKYSSNIRVVGNIKILDVPQDFKEKTLKNPNIEFEKQFKRKKNTELLNYQNYLACPKSKINHKLKGYNAFEKSLEYLTRVQNMTHNKILNLQKFYKNNSMYVDPTACVLDVGNFNDGE